MATIVEPIDQPDQRSEARYQQRSTRLRSYLPNLRGRQTYLNLLYLLAAFPLGTLYFVIFLTAILTCLGSLIGLVLVPPVLSSWRAVGSFERQLSIWWLDVEIAPFSLPLPPGLTFWQRLRARLSDRVTWSSLAYLFVKFPFGLFAFCAVGIGLAYTAALLSAPVGLLLQAIVDGPPADPTSAYLGAVGNFALGILLGFVLLLGSNGLAVAWGRFARLTLGMSDAAQRVAQAQAAQARAEVQAARAEQSRRELIVNASHELRTPIASIRGHVESLLLSAEGSETGTPPPEELKNYLQIIERESERLSALVDDVLALARADAGELKLDIQPVAVAGVIEEVYEALQPLGRRERQVTLVRDVPPDLPLALADRQRLAQVLLNLVRNAITYTPAGGIVSITVARPDPDHLVIVVADTGIGIPPEDLQRVFDRFYRTDASRARGSGGFGLGLAIVRDLVQAMGGSVSAESTVGEGSRFHVVLWVARAGQTLGPIGVPSAERMQRD
jgi:two-component system phosphate regulon sensor histidine kinase PhoR